MTTEMFLRMKKRGQVTPFIIAGILLLVILAGVGYFVLSSSSDVEDTFFAQQQIPEQVEPIQLFVESCVEGITQDALVEIGRHGGYISLDDAQLHSKNFVRNSVYPYQANTISLSDDLSVPYWLHLEDEIECSECTFSSEGIPTLDEIEIQIERYVSRELPGCLNDFSSFSEEGFTFETSGDVQTEVIFTKDDVRVTSNYVVEISKGETQFVLESFRAVVDLAFKQIYEDAYALTQFLYDNQTFETITMSLVSVYSGVNHNLLPPIAEFTTGYETVSWSKSATKALFTDLLQSTLPLVSFAHSANDFLVSNPEFSEYQQGIFGMLHVDSGLFEEIPFEISVLYFNFPNYFEITPSDGDLLTPSIDVFNFFENLVPAEQLNSYEFFYDISYPVVLQFRDPDAFSGEGYSFMFGYEVAIRDNRDFKRWSQGLGTTGSREPFVATLTPSENIDPENSATFIYDGADSGTSPPPSELSSVTGKKLFCDRAQRLSGKVGVEVMDSSGNGVSGATVKYSCGIYAECVLGSTDEFGSFENTFPLCQSGHVTIEKQGFIPQTIALTTQKEVSADLSVSLEESNALDVSVKQIPLELLRGMSEQGASASFVKLNARELEEAQHVVLTMTRVRETVLDLDQVVFFSTQRPEQIYLTPGNYIVTGTLFDESGTTVSRDQVQVSSSQSLADSAVTLDSVMLGGLIADEETGYFEVTKSESGEATELTFYVIGFKPPQTTQDLQEVNKLKEYSILYQDLLRPDFK